MVPQIHRIISSNKKYGKEKEKKKKSKYTFKMKWSVDQTSDQRQELTVSPVLKIKGSAAKKKIQ